MIQHPSNAPHLGAAIATTSPAQRSTTGRIARTVAAGVISVGLVGIFAFPAYATPEVEEARFYTPVQQELTTADAEVAMFDAQAPVAKKAEPQAVLAAEVSDENENSTAEPKDALGGKDLPAGKGAPGLIAAALAQVGDAQDCTALVERALRAIGYSVGDAGVEGFNGFGEVITSGAYAPGDILVWPGQPHVAIYIGNGQAVHGGYNGSTVVADYRSMGQTPAYVVRLA